jgi:ABC-2 type transport system permease protein
MTTSNPLTMTDHLQKTTRRALPPVVTFALANLKGSLRNRVMMAVALLTPNLLLFMFWLLGRAATAEFNLLAFIFPGIVAFTIIQTGGMHATTICNWREQGIFKRLACTPAPLWQLVLGRSLSQLILSLVQAFLVVLVGVLLLRLPISWTGLLLSFLVLALGSACFIALGAVIAGLSPNATIANSVYVFLIIPLMFLGDSLMPAELFPAALQKIGLYLPTAMVTSLVRPLMNQGVLPADPWLPLLGLLLYTGLFVALSAKLFRWH